MAGGLRIALLIRSLNYGGAEMQVTILANGLARCGHVVSVLVFYPNGPLIKRLSPDVTVRCLEKRGRWDLRSFLGRLRVLEEERPDVRSRPDLVSGPRSYRFPASNKPVVGGQRAIFDQGLESLHPAAGLAVVAQTRTLC